MVRFQFALSAAVLLVPIQLAPAAELSQIVKVADTSTPIPGGSGDFNGFGAVSGATFIGQGDNGQDGIYTFGTNGPLDGVLADTNTTAAGLGAGVDFASFSSVSFGAEGTSFIATTTTGIQAVYDSWHGSLVLIAQSGQSPSAGVTFNSFTNVSSTYQNNAQLPLTGEFLSDAGIYYFFAHTDGSGNVIQPANVDFTLEANTTIVPAGSSLPFSALGQPNFKSGYPAGARLADSTIQSMRASVNGVQGIYFSMPNGPSSGPAPFTKLADTATPSIVQFTSFGNPAANIDYLVFTAHYNNGGSDQQGIFGWGNYFDYEGPYNPYPTLQQLVTGGSVAPDSNGAHFKDFLGVTPNGTFLANLDNGTEGIYSIWTNSADSALTGPVMDLIDTTDTLDGKTIASFDLPTEADYLGYGSSFIVHFTDGSQGLYFFSPFIPEPTSLCLCGLAALTLTRRRSFRGR